MIFAGINAILMKTNYERGDYNAGLLCITIQNNPGAQPAA